MPSLVLLVLVLVVVLVVSAWPLPPWQGCGPAADVQRPGKHNERQSIPGGHFP